MVREFFTVNVLSHQSLLVNCSLFLYHISNLFIFSGNMNMAVLNFGNWLWAIAQSSASVRKAFECTWWHDFWQLPKVQCQSPYCHIHATLLVNCSLFLYHIKNIMHNILSLLLVQLSFDFQIWKKHRGHLHNLVILKSSINKNLFH
jgi:hypothetical protein